MANNYTAEVLRYLRRKGSTPFDEPITWLGAEQRFVGALRNSTVNNLEEQYVLGTDTYTVTYEDLDGNIIIEKSFCVTNADLADASDYYKVITTIYNSESIKNDDYKFEGDGLYFANTNVDTVFGDGTLDYPDITAVYCLDPKTFAFDNEDFNISPSTFTVTRKDELYFVKQNEPDLLVLTKLTGFKYQIDGKKVVREQIINALNP